MFGFNSFHKNALKIVETKINNFFKEETIHGGSIKIGGNIYNVAGVVVSFSPNEIAERIIKDYKVDFVIMLNLKGKSVYMRRSCGGGHHDSAGGTLNDSIINITKLLKPLNEK